MQAVYNNVKNRKKLINLKFKFFRTIYKYKDFKPELLQA